MTATETINETVNETVNETTQTDSFSSVKQGRLKKYTNKKQATIAAREQRKNARIRYKQNQSNFVSKINDIQLLIIKTLKKLSQIQKIYQQLMNSLKKNEPDKDINEDANDDINI